MTSRQRQLSTLTTDCSGVHIDHLVDHIQALLTQESSAGYRGKDYLGILCSPTVQHEKKRKKRKLAELHQQPAWHMSARDRWQIAQWFYGSKLLSGER